MEHKYINTGSGKQQNTDETVNGEKRGIYAAQVGRLDQAVLVQEQERHRSDAAQADAAQPLAPEEPGEDPDHGGVRQGRGPERSLHSEALGDGIEGRPAVELDVLAGV